MIAQKFGFKDQARTRRPGGRSGLQHVVNKTP